ncbi:hypothetical protein EPUS_07630 [Endocarpon pusillum Z07020]|uniref:Uncharacterized protein n=1 Tax=Endocarpon pusillum (strain Z07020 / HMAS-L-300199) TaxID=1263415 RepID=U1I0T8_ENDPU|nr:uncharacterized protein EPUS_07630 [Endocarpon pusillum Z07020]ERF76840.1 hypothetical protein EPUS_07630 [Endocarpon pusillum Z07020]
MSDPIPSKKRKASGSLSPDRSEGPNSVFPLATSTPATAANTGPAQNYPDTTAASSGSRPEVSTYTTDEIQVAGILAGMGSTVLLVELGGNDPSGGDDKNENSGGDEDGSDAVSGSESDTSSTSGGSFWSYPETDGTNWNPLIPRSSWAIPVGNTPYAGSPALVTPRPEGATTTLDQQHYRIATLRNVLGEPSGVTYDELRAALEGNRWDMGSALKFVNHRLNEALRRELTNQPGRDANQLERDRLLGANSLHHNRRLAVDALYQRLITAQPTARPQLTTLNVGVLLVESRFDLDEAVAAFRERQLHPRQFQDATRRLRRLRIPGPNQCHQDERIALFMTIAGIDDYYAARVLFETHNWDMGRAMDQWMQNGLRSAPHAAPANIRRRRTYQEPVLLHDDTENLWAAGRPFGGAPPAPDAHDLLDAAEDYGQGSYARRNGWFINFRRDPGVRVGVMNPSRMGLLWIRRGEFKLIWYGDRGPVEDPARPGQPLQNGGTIPFDWNNPLHISDLGGNKTAQWFRRNLGISVKVRGDSYQADENEWLWHWHNDRLFEYMEAHPEFWNSQSYQGTTGTWNGTWNEIHHQEWGRTVPYPRQRLERDFNHRFTTQTHLPGMNGQPRQARTSASLDMQRRRVREICDDFGFDYSPAHPKRDPTKGDGDGDDEFDDGGEGPSGTNARKDSGGKRKDRREDAGQDDEIEGDVGEDGSSPPTKRAKPTPKGKENVKATGKGKGKGKAEECEDGSEHDGGND